MNCPACRSLVTPGANFCPTCGTPLTTTTPKPHPLGGTTRPDQLPPWLRQDVASSSITDDEHQRHHTQPPRQPIPDGGLSEIMPAWLAPTTAPHSQIAPMTPSPLSDSHPPQPSASSQINQAELIDVTQFLSAEDLPAWIRRIAEPQPNPPPESVLTPPQPIPSTPPVTSPTARPHSAQLTQREIQSDSDDNDATKQLLTNIDPHSANTQPSTQKQEPSWNLVFLAISLILVALAGYTIYLVSLR